MKTKLIPPDVRQCQAEHVIGTFVLGGRIGARMRCSHAPTVIATEKTKGADGQRGSMSLCADCLVVARRTMPPFSTKPIAKKHLARREAAGREAGK